MSQSPSIIPGSTVNDRFTLTRPLGKGSMGTVWLARHLALDIDVALKFIDSSLTKQINYVERFRREARAAAQISSPHVVSVLDYGMDQKERPFMAMEYLQGETLGEFLAGNPKLGPETVARIVSHAARGLSKAHALGVVHRDIKPENLFLCGESDEESFVLKILDFGVAKSGLATSGHGTLAGQLIGSPAYMSPEQARSYRSIDHRTDLFSLAVVAYQCLTGKHPFEGNGLGEILLSICTSTPTPPSQLVPELPAELDRWFEKALAKKPHQRFQSGRELGVSFCDVLGLNVASGVDVRSSFSSLSLENSRDMPEPEFFADARQADSMATRVISPSARPSNPTATRIEPVSIADALTPLTSIPNALGVALLDHNDECLLMRGKETEAKAFKAIAQRARSVAETVESVESMTAPTHLSARFDDAAIYVRWIGSFTLVVHGNAQLRSLLLTVGSNKLAARLEGFLEELGGVEPAANLLRDSGVGLPSEALEQDLGQVPLPSMQRTMVAADPSTAELEPAPQSEDGGELPMKGFWGLGRARRKPTRADPPVVSASRAITTPDGPQARAAALKSTQAAGDSSDSLGGPPSRRERVLVHRGKVVGGAVPNKEEKPKKRVMVYRGRVIDEK